MNREITFQKLLFLTVILATQILGKARGERPEFAQALQNVSVPLGGDAEFSCVITHLGGYKVQYVGWVRVKSDSTKSLLAIDNYVHTNSTRISVTQTDQNTWNLHIVNVQEEDQGLYMCRINIYPKMTQVGYLEVTVPPQITDKESSSDIEGKVRGELPDFAQALQNVSVPVGGDAVFSCVVTNLGSYMVWWLRVESDSTKSLLAMDNYVLTHSTRISVTQIDQNTSNLHIVNVKEEDQGLYMCKIGIYPTITQVGYLEVTVPPQITDKESSSDIGGKVRGELPDFAQALQNVSVPVGGDAVFSCVVTNLGSYMVGWIRPDLKLILAIHTLVITSNPRVSVTHPDQNTWNLHIENVQEKDQGIYLCQINTDRFMSQAGYLEVTVPPQMINVTPSTIRTSPVVFVPSTNILVRKGLHVVLDCYVEASPNSILYWTREDGVTLIDDNEFKITEQLINDNETHMKLVIESVQRHHSGTYYCNAKNSFGEDAELTGRQTVKVF